MQNDEIRQPEDEAVKQNSGEQAAEEKTEQGAGASACGSDKTAEDKAAEVKTEENRTAEEDSAGSSAGNTEAAAEKIKDPALAKAEKEAADYKDRYTRLYAEFDNFRKRTDKEKSQMFEMGEKDVIERILPIVDNFERALQTVEDEHRDDAFTKGVEGIYRQIQKAFEELDVKPIEAVGKKFDANLHNAVMTDSEGDCEEDTITQDLQKGYTFRGQVVRHSMVKVKK